MQVHVHVHVYECTFERSLVFERKNSRCGRGCELWCGRGVDRFGVGWVRQCLHGSSCFIAGGVGLWVVGTAYSNEWSGERG
jgi:hypothetical protein